MEFDMLRLGVFTLEEAGGESESFLARIKELEERWAELEAEAARLQQEIYDSVQEAWKKKK